jgi:hypothetical protein
MTLGERRTRNSLAGDSTAAVSWMARQRPECSTPGSWRRATNHEGAERPYFGGIRDACLGVGVGVSVLSSEQMEDLRGWAESRTKDWLPIEAWGPKCEGCGADEYRIDGYCSIECRDYFCDDRDEMRLVLFLIDAYAFYTRAASPNPSPTTTQERPALLQRQVVPLPKVGE